MKISNRTMGNNVFQKKKKKFNTPTTRHKLHNTKITLRLAPFNPRKTPRNQEARIQKKDANKELVPPLSATMLIFFALIPLQSYYSF